MVIQMQMVIQMIQRQATSHKPHVFASNGGAQFRPGGASDPGGAGGAGGVAIALLTPAWRKMRFFWGAKARVGTTSRVLGRSISFGNVGNPNSIAKWAPPLRDLPTPTTPTTPAMPTMPTTPTTPASDASDVNDALNTRPRKHLIAAARRPPSTVRRPPPISTSRDKPHSQSSSSSPHPARNGHGAEIAASLDTLNCIQVQVRTGAYSRIDRLFPKFPNSPNS